jgi:hypothetical protein
MPDNLPGMESSDSENPTPIELDADSFDQLQLIANGVNALNVRLDTWETFFRETVGPLLLAYGPILENFLRETPKND